MKARISDPVDAARLPDGAGPPRLIVCESTGRWAVALRRDLAEPWPLSETRSVAECWELLAKVPASFVVVEVTSAHLQTLLDRMAWWERDFPLARLAAVADQESAPYQWLLREAGAVHVALSCRHLRPLVDLALRHLGQIPLPQRTLVEQIWAGLPWATGSSP